MYGRGGRVHRHVIEGRRAHPHFPEGPYARPVPPTLPPRPHPSVLQEEFELQQIELRRLTADHRALLEDRLALQRELAIGKDEIHRLSMVMSDIRTEKESYIRELIDKGLKLESDLRAIEPLRGEVIQLRKEIEKQVKARKELVAKLEKLNKEISRAKSENQQLPNLLAEIDRLRQELTRARNAAEFEKKANMEMVEQRSAMEKNMVMMARDIEKFKAELASTEARPSLGLAGAYGIKHGSPVGTYTSSYGDSYKLQQGIGEKPPLYGPGSSSWGEFDKNRFVRR